MYRTGTSSHGSPDVGQDLHREAHWSRRLGVREFCCKFLSCMQVGLNSDELLFYSW